MERIIGRYNGAKEGPLLVILAAVHGNEPAGVVASEVVLKMLNIEPYINKDFEFAGNVLALIGNMKAYKEGKRFIKRDLNRCWTPSNIDSAKNGDTSIHEKMEMLEIYETITKEIKTTKAKKLIVLDMHTTSSDQGIFSIPSEDPLSLKIAKELHAPVVTGMVSGLGGTSLHFFVKENTGIETTAIVFESGQHEDPLSINRALAGIINCMRTIGCVKPDDVVNKHDDLLIEFSKDLPKVNELVYSHEITEVDEFKMKAGYVNFQKIEKGEHVAFDIKGQVHSPYAGRILMPLYQAQGEDGFFIIKDID